MVMMMTTEIRRGKKKKKKEETTWQKYNGLPYGGHNKVSTLHKMHKAI